MLLETILEECNYSLQSRTGCEELDNLRPALSIITPRSGDHQAGPIWFMMITAASLMALSYCLLDVFVRTTESEFLPACEEPLPDLPQTKYDQIVSVIENQSNYKNILLSNIYYSVCGSRHSEAVKI